MTMASSVSKVTLNGDGVQTAWPFSFKVWKAADLEISITNAEGVTTVVSNWSVVLAGTGGTVTYPTSGSPLPSGSKITIRRSMDFLQDVDLVSGTRWNPEVVETALDQAMAERQQLKEEVARSLKLDVSDTTSPEALLTSIFEARDTAVDNAASAMGSAERAEMAASTVTYYNHEGTLLTGESAISLPWAYDTSVGVEVFLGGVKQAESSLTFTDSYTVTLDAPVAADTPFEVTASSGAKGDLENKLAQPEGSSLIGFQQVGTGAAERTAQDKLRELVSVKDFGAIGDGVADDTVAIQRAIDSLPARGGVVYLPAGTYKVSSPITVGNGDGGATPSTKNGIKLRGAGAGFAVSGALVPTIIHYVGPSIELPLIDVKGQISDCEISGVFLFCNGNIGGISLKSFSGCVVERVKIIGPKNRAAALYIFGGTAPTGNYNTFNRFSQISIGLLYPYSIGLYVDGDYASVNDTWLSAFDLVRVETVAGATSAVCAWLKFSDSCSFRRCHFESKPEPTSLGLILDADGNPGYLNSYPVGHAFYDCSISNITVYEVGISKIGPCYFYGHGANDLETVPNHPRLFGVTANGDAFGWMPGFRERKNYDVNVQNTNAKTSIYEYLVGAYFLGGGDSFRSKNGGLRVKHFANYINVSGSNANLTITISLGGVTLFSIPFTSIPSGATGRSVQIDFTLSLVNNLVTAQAGQVVAVLGAVGSVTGTPAPPFATLTGQNSSPGLAINTSVAQTLYISVQHSVANGAIAYTAKSTIMELL